jgi:GH24 family phage-related lysozyme (muramidase)
MRVSQKGLDFVKSFECFVPHVYDDFCRPRYVNGRLTYPEWKGGAVRGTLTIGYGHTNSAKHPLKIKAGLRITEAQAQQILDVDLDECEGDVNRLVRVPIDQSEFDALVSFTFNCGAGNLRKLIVPLNRGDYDGTRNKFDAYVRSKGKFMRGLQRRRDDEQRMWDRQEVRLPTKPVYHPAEVDDASGTLSKSEKRAVVKNSRFLRWGEWYSNFCEYVGLSGGLLSTLIPAVASFVTDWRTLTVAAVLGGGYLAMKLSKFNLINAARQGRYVPSGGFWHVPIPATDGDSDAEFTNPAPPSPDAEAPGDAAVPSAPADPGLGNTIDMEDAA